MFAGRALCRMREIDVIFCVLCTYGHLSFCHFTQFCKVLKFSIEIPCPFMYNVTIRVSAPGWKESLPERSFINHVHCQFYP